MFVSRSCGAQTRRVLAIDQDAALGRHLEAGEHAQGRGLAAPARPEQREELSAPDIEAHAVDGDDLAEPLDDVFEGEGGLFVDACRGRSRHVASAHAHSPLLMTSPAAG